MEGVRDVVRDAPALVDAARPVERPADSEVDPALAAFFLGLRQVETLRGMSGRTAPACLRGMAARRSSTRRAATG
jgi:hypothetical protein